MLSPDTKRSLLNYARRIGLHYFHVSDSGPKPIASVHGDYGGLFVTLWGDGEAEIPGTSMAAQEGRRLRGCRGQIGPVNDVVAALSEVTRNTLEDPRFVDDPVTLAEFPMLTVEISLLSKPMWVEDPLELQPGTHGVIVQREGRMGCFLPKVAVSQGWDAPQLLSACCRMKAGLAEDAWREPETEVFLFTTEGFSSDRLIEGGADGQEQQNQEN